MAKGKGSGSPPDSGKKKKEKKSGTTKGEIEMENSTSGGTGNILDDYEEEIILAPAEEEEVELDKKGKPKKKKEEKPPKVPMSQLYRYADGYDKILMFVGSLGAVVHGSLLPAFSLLFGELIDAFNLPPDEMFDEIKRFSLYFVYAAIAAFVSSFIQQGFWSFAKERQIAKVKRLYVQAILRQEIAWFDENTTGALTTRIAGDTSVMGEAMGEKIGALIQFYGTFLFGFGLGFYKGWELTLVLLAITPLLAAAGGFMAVLMNQLTTQGQTAYAGAGSIATEVIAGIRTIASFGAESREAERFGEKINVARKIGVKKNFVSGFGMGATFFVFFASYGLALWYGGQLIIDGKYTGGTVLIVFFAVIMGAFSLGQAGPSAEALTAGQGAAYIIYGTIDRESKIDPTSSVGEKKDKVRGNIKLKNVTFRYPTRPEQPIFENLDLDIKKGQTVALVGQSGSGKSTTIQLLQRFYDPEEGKVCLDGTDLKKLNVNWLRSQIGLVSQEPVLFSGTIADNIAYGAVGGKATKLEIEDAAKSANAHNFISEFPDGYDTNVGEKGAQLSGGQKQRIAIARAIVKNPKILLLDEATSALDTKSEKVVQDALDKVMKGRTTIVVAHRLTTIRDADKIVVFEHGKVVEQGTHEELFELNGVYYELVQLQGGEQKKQKILKKKKKIQKAKISKIISKSAKNSSKKSEAETDADEYPPVSLGRLVRSNKPEFWFILMGCYGAFLQGIVNPGFAIVFGEIVGIFYQPPNIIEDDVPAWAILFVLFGLISFVGSVLQFANMGISAEFLTNRLRKNSFKAILRHDVGWFDEERHSTGILASRLASDALLVEGLLGSRLGLMVQNIVTIVVGLAIAFYYGWKLTLVILAASPMMAFAQMMQFLAMTGFTKKNQEAAAEANQVAVEAIGNIRTVAAFTAEERVQENFEIKGIGPEKQAKKAAFISGVLVGVGESMLFFAYALSFWYGGKLVNDGEMEFADMMKVFMAIMLSAMSVGQTAAFAPNAAKAKAAARVIFGMIDSIPEIDSLSNTGKKLKKLKGKIVFKKVDFVYPTRPKQLVLDEFSLEVNPGEILALVGESGCGKSSTIGVIQRYYDALSGKVTFDGEDIRDLNLKYLRSQIGFVGQEPVLFSGSIADNIKYGKPDATQKEIEAACVSANAHKFIGLFPDGYDTKVGEKGAQLSGGQKQRIAIARAIIKDPKILLLDEATSALDSESEKVVQDALDKVMRGRTTIVVAHRLTTIRHADKIAVIDAGNVAEIGTHDELMNKQALYYSLVQRQVSES